MPNISEDFWTDEEQAAQRLNGSLVLYDNAPALVDSVEDRLVHFYSASKQGEMLRAALNDEKWGKYRNVPACGWYNYDYRQHVRAIYISRFAARTRSHGLTRHNCKFFEMSNAGLADSATISLLRAATSTVMANCFKEGYPTYQGLLDAGALQEQRSFAINRNFALYCCWDNIPTIYHKKREVGFVVANTTYLFAKHSYLREELLENTDLPREIKEA